MNDHTHDDRLREQAPPPDPHETGKTARGRRMLRLAVWSLALLLFQIDSADKAHLLARRPFGGRGRRGEIAAGNDFAAAGEMDENRQRFFRALLPDVGENVFDLRRQRNVELAGLLKQFALLVEKFSIHRNLVEARLERRVGGLRNERNGGETADGKNGFQHDVSSFFPVPCRKGGTAPGRVLSLYRRECGLSIGGQEKIRSVRSRIQAGLSSGIILVQSKIDGGSKYTLDKFVKLRRVVGVVHFPTNPEYPDDIFGANRLIVEEKEYGLTKFVGLKTVKTLNVKAIIPITSKDDYKAFEDKLTAQLEDLGDLF